MAHDDFSNFAFGELVLKLRKDRNWTVRDFIEELSREGKPISPAYVTRIEQYGEIPTPDLVIKIAQVFKVDAENFLHCAKNSKLKMLKENLEEKYQRVIDTLQDKVERGKQRYGSK